jgi:hypothetical protein
MAGGQFPRLEGEGSEESSPQVVGLADGGGVREGMHPRLHVPRRRIAGTLSELKPLEGKNIVTLQTCTLPDFKNRLLVRGELKEVSEG